MPNELSSANVTQEELLAVLKYLFRQYVIDQDVDTDENLYSARMEDFVNWCEQARAFDEHHDRFVNSMNIREASVDAIRGVIEGNPWRCAAMLMPMWPIFALQHRPQRTNAIKSTRVSFAVTFADGTVAQITGGYRHEPGSQIGDGFICALLQDQLAQIVNTVAANGFDKLHDEHAQEPAETPGDVTTRPIAPPPPGRMGF